MQDEFWIGVYSTIAAALVLGALGWFAQQFWIARAKRLLPSRVSLVFEETDQYRRSESVQGKHDTFVRTFYVIGVVNRSGSTLHGVQCFVTDWDFEMLPDPSLPRKHPLQPVGQPKGAERIDVPPSTNNQPSAYFELVDILARSTASDSDGANPTLCSTYGLGSLPFNCTISASLEGDGFVLPALFSVATRIPRTDERDVQLIPLTVKRLPV